MKNLKKLDVGFFGFGFWVFLVKKEYIKRGQGHKVTEQDSKYSRTDTGKRYQ